MLEKLNDKSVNKGLHWTTIASEKAVLAIIGISTCIAAALYLYEMILLREITLSDLFMLFIYAEILGMVGSFYSTSRIPVTLPIIIAITDLFYAICIVLYVSGKVDDYFLLLGFWFVGLRVAHSVYHIFINGFIGDMPIRALLWLPSLAIVIWMWIRFISLL